MAEVPSTFELKPGDHAPQFSLPDAQGTLWDLRNVVGPRGVLVFFACNHCPYVIHLGDALGEFAREIGALGIGTIAINSNDVEKYPADAPSLMPVFSEKHRWEFPYVYDASQEVAHAYGAACTPDFFLFDHDLKLSYAGQFDASRPKNTEPVTGNDLRKAVLALVEGKAFDGKVFPSTGCNIKWKEGNSPFDRRK